METGHDFKTRKNETDHDAGPNSTELHVIYIPIILILTLTVTSLVFLVWKSKFKGKLNCKKDVKNPNINPNTVELSQDQNSLEEWLPPLYYSIAETRHQSMQIKYDYSNSKGLKESHYVNQYLISDYITPIH